MDSVIVYLSVYNYNKNHYILCVIVCCFPTGYSVQMLTQIEKYIDSRTQKLCLAMLCLFIWLGKHEWLYYICIDIGNMLCTHNRPRRYHCLSVCQIVYHVFERVVHVGATVKHNCHVATIESKRWFDALCSNR